MGFMMMVVETGKAQLAIGVVVAYGLFCEVGGVIGFVKAKSRASLIAGSISGLILFVCAWLLYQAKAAGAIGSLGVAVLLGGRFLMTWMRSKKLMPDLLMVLLSVATLVAVLPLL